MFASKMQQKILRCGIKSCSFLLNFYDCVLSLSSWWHDWQSQHHFSESFGVVCASNAVLQHLKLSSSQINLCFVALNLSCFITKLNPPCCFYMNEVAVAWLPLMGCGC